MIKWTAELQTDFSQDLTLVDLQGTVYNLTGYGLTAEVRLKPNGSLLASLTVNVTDATNGLVTVSLTDTQIDAIGAGNFLVDIKLVRISDSIVFRTERALMQITEIITVT